MKKNSNQPNKVLRLFHATFKNKITTHEMLQEKANSESRFYLQ